MSLILPQRSGRIRQPAAGGGAILSTTLTAANAFGAGIWGFSVPWSVGSLADETFDYGGYTFNIIVVMQDISGAVYSAGDFDIRIEEDTNTTGLASTLADLEVKIDGVRIPSSGDVKWLEVETGVYFNVLDPSEDLINDVDTIDAATDYDLDFVEV